MCSIFELIPKTATKVILSTRKNNRIKLNTMLDIIFNTSTIGVVYGGRGSGKTVFMQYLAEQAYNRGMNVCLVNFMPDDLEDFPKEFNVKIYDSVSECPHNSFILHDEYGTKNKEWNSEENKDNTRAMVVSRHDGRSILYCSQNWHHFPKDMRLLLDYEAIKKQSFTAMKETPDDNFLDVFCFEPKTKPQVYFKSDTFQALLQNPLPTFREQEVLS
jgi:hypothetical protein